MTLDPEILALLDDTPEPREPDDLVTVATLAEFTGLTTSRLNGLARDGIIPRVPNRGGHLFPLKAAVRAYCEWTRAAAARRAADPDLAAEKLRLTRAQADRAEQQAARTRGDLLPAAEVEAAWTATLADLRAALLAAPERVAARMSLDRATAAALGDEIRLALASIADDLAGPPPQTPDFSPVAGDLPDAAADPHDDDLAPTHEAGK